MSFRYVIFTIFLISISTPSRASFHCLQILRAAGLTPDQDTVQFLQSTSQVDRLTVVDALFESNATAVIHFYSETHTLGAPSRSGQVTVERIEGRLDNPIVWVRSDHNSDVSFSIPLGRIVSVQVLFSRFPLPVSFGPGMAGMPDGNTRRGRTFGPGMAGFPDGSE